MGQVCVNSICPAAPRWYEGQQTCDGASKDPPTYILAIEMRKVAAFLVHVQSLPFSERLEAPHQLARPFVMSLRRWHLGQFLHFFPLKTQMQFLCDLPTFQVQGR